MKRFSLKQIIIVCFIIAMILFVLSVIVVISERKQNKFYDKIIIINSRIKYFDYDKAEKLLNEINLKQLSKKSSLIFLKRSFQLSKKTGNFNILYEHCQKIKNRYKRNVEIQAITAFACNMVGKSEDVVKKYKKKIKKTKYKKIYEVGLLKTGIKDADIDSKYYNIINDIVSIDSLNELIKLENDHRFVLDLTLLYLQDNHFEKAHKTIKLTPKNNYRRLKMYTGYASKDFNSAEYYFHQIQEKIDFNHDLDEFLLGGDILLKKGEYSKAETIYKKILSQAAAPPFVYRNLFVINKNKELWLKRGLEEFPNNNQLLIPLVYKAIKEKNNEKLSELLPLLSNDESGMKELIILKSEMSERKVEHNIASYWMIINNFDYTETIIRDFMIYLIMNRREAEIATLIIKCKKDEKYSEWLDVYYAILLFLENNNDKAIQNIELSIKEIDSLEKCYNYAVMLFFEENYHLANNYLDKAVLMINDKTSDKLVAKIYYKKAQIHFNQGDFEKARNNIIIAEDYNNNDMVIRKFFRELEAK